MRHSGFAALLTAAALVFGSGAAGLTESSSAVEVYAAETYTFTDIDGNTVTTGSGKPTAVVFGRPGCWNSRQTLTYLAQTSWISQSEVTVIYADTDGNTAEDVRTFREETGGCEYIHYCTDPSYNSLMWSFVKGEYTVTCPVIVYFDGEGNQLGVTQALQMPNDIYAALMGNNDTDSAKNYYFNDIDGNMVSTANGKPTAVVFGSPTCGNARMTLSELSEADWVKNGDAAIIYADYDEDSAETVAQFKSEVGCEEMHFCVESFYLNLMWSFVDEQYYETGILCPLIVYFDAAGNQFDVTQGYQAADDIREKLLGSAPLVISTDEKLGDLDSDGAVNASDAADLLIALAKMGAGEDNPLTAAQQKSADVDGSGVADAADATLILQYAAYFGAGGSGSLEEFIKQG